jgi:hypothetical protein
LHPAPFAAHRFVIQQLLARTFSEDMLLCSVRTPLRSKSEMCGFGRQVKHLAATPAASLEAMIKAEKAAGRPRAHEPPFVGNARPVLVPAVEHEAALLPRHRIHTPGSH